MTRKLEFFFDVVSPTAYLAWTQLPALVERTGAELDYRPMFLGGVMASTGNRPPGTVEAKGRWMTADLARFAARYGEPFQLNPAFPMNTLPIMRAAMAWNGRPDFEAFLKTIFEAIWVNAKDVAQEEVLTQALADGGLDPEAFWAAAKDPANKEALKANTDEAIARGVFGAPSFFVGDELHFGQDRLDFVENALTR